MASAANLGLHRTWVFQIPRGSVSQRRHDRSRQDDWGIGRPHLHSAREACQPTRRADSQPDRPGPLKTRTALPADPGQNQFASRSLNRAWCTVTQEYFTATALPSKVAGADCGNLPSAIRLRRSGSPAMFRQGQTQIPLSGLLRSFGAPEISCRPSR